MLIAIENLNLSMSKKELESTIDSSSTNGHTAPRATAVFNLDLEAVAKQIAAAILPHLEKRQERTVESLTPALLLTPRQAAEVLCISERMLWDLKEAGEIPVIPIGRAVRYARSDLESWIARRRSVQNELPGEPHQDSE
jgi:excisionase family DNA binding protein